MLNEIAEFNNYTFDYTDIDAVRDSRIKYDTFVKIGSLSGIKRMMTTIARYFYFANKDRENATAYTLQALKLWLGDTDECTQDEEEIREDILADFSNIENWLPSFLDAMAEYYKPIKGSQYNACKKVKDELLAFYDHLGYAILDYRGVKAEQKMIGVSAGRVANTYRAINYEKVISNAISQGELKCYYLVTLEGWDKQLFKVQTDKKSPKYGVTKKIGAPDHDKIIKLIAYYLLAEKRLPIRAENKTHYVPATLIDLDNWLRRGSVEKPYIESIIYEHNGKQHILFDYENVDSVVKIRLNDQFRKDFDCRIIDATEDDDTLKQFLLDNKDKKYEYYADEGGYEALLKNEYYE